MSRRNKALGGGSVYLCVDCGTPAPEREPQARGREHLVRLAAVLGLFSLLLLTFGITVVDSIVHPMDEPVSEQQEASRE